MEPTIAEELRTLGKKISARRIDMNDRREHMRLLRDGMPGSDNPARDNNKIKELRALIRADERQIEAFELSTKYLKGELNEQEETV